MTQRGRTKVLTVLGKRGYNLVQTYGHQEIGYGAIMQTPGGNIIDLFCKWDVRDTLGKELAELAFS